MTIAITPITAADSSFSAAGLAAWNAGMQMTGLGTNQLLYSTGATTLAQSANLTFDGTTFAIATNKFAADTSGNLTIAAAIQIGDQNAVSFGTPAGGNTRGGFRAAGDGVFRFFDHVDGNTCNIIFGSQTSAFPMLKRSSATLQIRLADDTAYATYDGKFSAEGTAGVASFGPSPVTSITVKDGIITAIS